MQPHEIKPDTGLCTILGHNAQTGYMRKYFNKIISKKIVTGIFSVAGTGTGIFDQIPIVAVFMGVAHQMNSVVVSSSSVAKAELACIFINVL